MSFMTVEGGGISYYRGYCNGTTCFCTWSYGWNNWGLLQLWSLQESQEHRLL